MVAYPESLTDPSYAGQILVITYPLVGWIFRWIGREGGFEKKGPTIPVRSQNELQTQEFGGW